MFLLAGLFPSQWLHPGGSGYWFYSGVFDVGILLGIVSSVGVYWRAHNCHVNRCWRLDWHPHPAHDHPVCRRHHPDSGAEFLQRRHHRPGSSASTETPEPLPAQFSRADRSGRNGSGSPAAAQSDASGGAGETGN